MRDPAGTISFTGDRVARALVEPALHHHFLRSKLASEWVERGDLVDFELVGDFSVYSRKISFVTHPTEWTPDQVYQAALLTLKLQREANASGWDLKDASAWNIVFDGLRPVFVDLLSFEPLEAKRWWAAGQFVRHFLLPLLLDKYGYLQPSQCFRLWRDGVPADFARRCLGWRRFGSRYWPLMTRSNGKLEHPREVVSNDQEQILDFRFGLDTTMAWMLSGLVPQPALQKDTVWGVYEDSREHYSAELLSYKRDVISTWLKKIRPAWVLDVGCNAGEFSEIAVSVGARVVCWDSDQQALTKLCRKQRENHRFFPLLSPIDNVSGGLGWMGEEFPSFSSRLKKQFDVVMLLAIIHHLAIANGVPLKKIFDLARYSSRSMVVAELLSENDVRVLQLCRQHKRTPSDFALLNQYRAAEECGLKRIESMRLRADSTRELALFEVP